MKIRELFEFAASKGDGPDDAAKIRALVVGAILQAASLKGKDQLELSESLERVDTEYLGQIGKIVKDIIDCSNKAGDFKDEDDIELEPRWYETDRDFKLYDAFYDAATVMYERAVDRIIDKRKLTAHHAGQKLSHDHEFFPYNDRLIDELMDIKEFIQKLGREIPMFAAAVKQGEDNFKKRKKR